MGRSLTNNEFLEKLSERRGSEYVPLELYKNTTTKIKVKHTCGNEILIRPNDLLSGKNCPICSLKSKKSKLKKGKKIFQEEINKLYNNEYEVLSEYHNYLEKVKIKHKNCGNEYEIIPGNFLKGQKLCPFCISKNSNKQKTSEEFKNQIKDLVGNDYILISDYKNVKTKIKIRHNICHHEYDVLPTNFLKGRRCPLCWSSHGEDIIRKYLQEHNLSYIPEKTFPDLKDKSFLRFDFYLEKINTLIEYDGEYHYIPLKGQDYLEKQQYRDQLKNKYCKDKNIKLIRIAYWDQKNIKNILDKNL